jgi:hypothetical protein
MTSTPDSPVLPAPSLARLGKTTTAAIAVAVIVLFMFVLPAEYAVDPLGTGRLLGLTDIAAPPSDAAAAVPEGAPLVPTQTGPVGAYPREFKLDVFEFSLEPYQFIEYKYQMEKGATMLFAWTASDTVEQELHGQRPAGATDGPAEESFDKQSRRQATGSYTAPFAGIHGWYWENPGGEAIAMRVSAAGFFSSAIEVRSNRSRHPHALKSLDALLAAPAAAPAKNEK